MAFFTNFPDIQYKFGDEQNPDVFANLSIYADVLDQLKDNIAFYYDYTIEEFERPDQLSNKIYGTPNYHWTFFMLNDNIRERGWPLSNSELLRKAQELYPLTTITTRTQLTTTNRSIGESSIFQSGAIITGNTSGASAVVDHRHLNLGQLVIKNLIGTFIDGETISSVNSEGDTETIVLQSTSLEYNAAHHYENVDGETVDIDPTVGPGALLTEVTYIDRINAQNEELKQIKVIKPSSINQVVNSFREAIRS